MDLPGQSQEGFRDPAGFHQQGPAASTVRRPAYGGGGGGNRRYQAANAPPGTAPRGLSVQQFAACFAGATFDLFPAATYQSQPVETRLEVVTQVAKQRARRGVILFGKF